MTPVPSAFSFIGIAKEVTPGTGVAPTFYLPVKTITPLDVIKYLEVPVFTGSMGDLKAIVQGFKNTTFDIAGPIFPDSIGWPLAGLLGDITTTGTTAPYSHAISLKNSGAGQPTSHTLTDFYAVTQARQYAGNQWHDLQLKGTADGLLEYTAKSTGLVPSAQVTKPVVSLTALLPIPTWQTVVTIGGVAQATTGDWEVNLARKVVLVPGLNGSQQYNAVFIGNIAVTGKLTCFMPDDTELTRYLTNTQPSIDLNCQSGAGAGAVQLDLHMTVGAYTLATKKVDKDYVAIDIEWKSPLNATDAGASGGLSPIKCTLQNALPSGTYV